MGLLLIPAIFVLVSWFLFIFAGGDISKIFNWTKYLYKIMFPISCFMWVYESAKTGKWLEFKNFTTLTLFINLFFIIILLTSWLAFKNLKGTMKDDIMDHYYGTEYTSQISTQQRIMVFLVLSIVFNPIINISCIVHFIKNFIL